MGGTNNIPPPPDGFSMIPPPPAGFSVVKPSAPAVQPEQLDALKNQNNINDTTQFSTSVSDSDNTKLESVAAAGSATPQAGQMVGAVKSFLQPATTIAKLLHKGGEKMHAGLGEAIAPQSGIDRMDTATQTRSADETGGEMMETIAEFALGDEAIKGLSLPQKLAKIAPVLKTLEKSPKLASALYTAIRSGTVATGQGLAHGEDPATAAEQGAGTAAGGLAFEGVSQGARAFLQKNGWTMEKVGGVLTKIPAWLRSEAATEAQASGQAAIKNAAQETTAQHLESVNRTRAIPSSPKMLPSRTGPYEFTIKGMNPTEAESGSTVVPAAEMPRTRITGLPENPPPGSESARNVSELGSTANATPAKLMRDQPYMTSAAEGAQPHSVEAPQGGGVMKTQDPQVAKAHLANVNEIMNHPDFEKLPPEQQQALTSARDDIRNQLTEYHDHMKLQDPRYNKPNFPQIDVPETVKGIGSYSDAAQHMEKIATDGYNSISDALQLNDISGGKFATIRNANREAWDAYKGASNVEAMNAAEKAIDETNQQMAHMLSNDIGGAVTPEELDGFNRAYASAQKLKYIAQAVDGSFSGNVSASARSWEYRGFDGNKLMSNLNRLEQKFGRASLERTVGKEQLDTLYQVASLNRTNASRAKFGVAVHQIAKWVDSAGGAFSHLAPIAIGGEVGRATGIGWGLGATAGEGIALATKKVMNMVLSNPKLAQNLIFAIDSGARPQYYAPMIGAMMQQLEKNSGAMKDEAENWMSEKKDELTGSEKDGSK